MAKNVFRITPRASQAIRAIENQERDIIKRAQQTTRVCDVRLTMCDLRFEERDGKTLATFSNCELGYFIDDIEIGGRSKLSGVVVMKKNNRGKNTWYAVYEVQFDSQFVSNS